jgi:hypothetical protein
LSIRDLMRAHREGGSSETFFDVYIAIVRLHRPAGLTGRGSGGASALSRANAQRARKTARGARGRASVRPRHGSSSWQHGGGPWGANRSTRLAVRYQPRPLTFASVLRPSGRGGLRSGLFRWSDVCLDRGRSHLQLAGAWGRSHEPLSRLRVGGGSPRGAASSGAAARGSWGHSSGCLTAGDASALIPPLSGGGTDADEGVDSCRVTRVPSGANGDAASGFMLDHRCQPSGAERWVATTLRGRRDVPETEHLRVRRAGYGGFPRDLSRRPDGLRVIPGAAQVDLRDDLACDRS